MILTNDGELANRLAHPRFGVEKMYRALVAGLPAPEMMAKLTEGVWLSDGKVRAKRARIVGRQGQATTLELVLAEGKKREIRRMLSKLGHKVMSFNRVAVGPIRLKGLSVGECRPLSRHEVELLRKVASGDSCRAPRFFDGGSSRPAAQGIANGLADRSDRAGRHTNHRDALHRHSTTANPLRAEETASLADGRGSQRQGVHRPAIRLAQLCQPLASNRRSIRRAERSQSARAKTPAQSRELKMKPRRAPRPRASNVAPAGTTQPRRPASSESSPSPPSLPSDRRRR